VSLTTLWSITQINEVLLTTADILLAVFVYVSFRNPYPEEATVKDVLKELQENNIDVKQLEILSANYCQNVESLKKEEVHHRDTGVGNGKYRSAISNNLG